MAGGGDFLGYSLYKDAAHATAWGSGAGAGMAIANATSKTARTFSVYGLVPQNQDSTVAAYTDTVVATINF
jgi:spore coat protein U-like protein